MISFVMVCTVIAAVAAGLLFASVERLKENI